MNVWRLVGGSTLAGLPFGDRRLAKDHAAEGISGHQRPFQDDKNSFVHAARLQGGKSLNGAWSLRRASFCSAILSMGILCHPENWRTAESSQSRKSLLAARTKPGSSPVTTRYPISDYSSVDQFSMAAARVYCRLADSTPVFDDSDFNPHPATEPIRQARCRQDIDLFFHTSSLSICCSRHSRCSVTTSAARRYSASFFSILNSLVGKP